MNKRQLIIIWLIGVSVSAFFIIQPVIIVPILILGGLSFWSFKDITSPLTKRFKFFIVLTIIIGLIIAISIGDSCPYLWFVKSQGTQGRGRLGTAPRPRPRPRPRVR